MAITLGILFGIIAMISWGTSDFFAAKIVRKIEVLRTFFWIEIVTLTTLLVPFLVFFEFPSLSFSDVLIILVTAFLALISILSFYKGLQVGTVSIISPIAASYAVVTVILSLIFLKETIIALQSIGISVVILGAILTSFKFHDLIRLKIKNIAKGVKYAVIAMFGWGILFIFVDILVSRLGWFLPLLFFVTVEIFYMLLYSGAAKKNISFPKNFALLVILIGILEATSFLSFGYGISLEDTAIIAPITSAFPAITIILARIFFKEILEINQKIGVISVLVGLVLLSI